MFACFRVFGKEHGCAGWSHATADARVKGPRWLTAEKRSNPSMSAAAMLNRCESSFCLGGPTWCHPHFLIHPHLEALDLVQV